MHMDAAVSRQKLCELPVPAYRYLASQRLMYAYAVQMMSDLLLAEGLELSPNECRFEACYRILALFSEINLQTQKDANSLVSVPSEWRKSYACNPLSPSYSESKMK